MAGYIIVRMTVTDWDRYKEYTRHTPAAVEAFGGRFIVRGGATMTLEGPEETARIVVLEFPSLERAKAFYESDTYQAAARLRAGAATAQFVAVEGV